MVKTLSDVFKGSNVIKKPKVVKKKFWTIRNIEEDTIVAIKAKAKKWDCTVPEILKTEFVNKSGWVLYNVDQKLRAKIEKDAQDKGMSISEFIRYLYNKDEKKNIIEQVRGFLDEIE